MIFLLLATILPFGTGILLTYYQTIKNINKESLSYNTELMVKGREELTTYLEDIALISTVLYRYTPFMNVLTQGVGENNKDNMEEVRRVLAYVYISFLRLNRCIYILIKEETLLQIITLE